MAHISVFSEENTQQALIDELNGLYGMGPSPQRYLHYLLAGGGRWVEAMRLFADEASYPVLIHCTAGKDRTGFAAALILLALGVPRDVVMRDYLLTNEFFRMPINPSSPLSQEVLRVLWRVQEEFLDAALHAVDADYGNVQSYMESALGVGP